MQEGIRALLATRESNWAALPLRIPLGMIFIAHGAQELFGWFGRHGPVAAGIRRRRALGGCGRRYTVVGRSSPR